MALTVLMEGKHGSSEFVADSKSVTKTASLMVMALLFASTEFVNGQQCKFLCEVIGKLVHELPQIQSSNRSTNTDVLDSDTHILVDGESMAVGDAKRLNGVSDDTFKWRVKHGWTIHRAATEKPNPLMSAAGRRKRKT